MLMVTSWKNLNILMRVITINIPESIVVSEELHIMLRGKMEDILMNI